MWWYAGCMFKVFKLDFTFSFSICIDFSQINTNGYITFHAYDGLHQPMPFPIPIPMIAPFWVDTDTTCEGLGYVYFRETTATSVRTKVFNDIKNYLSQSLEFYPPSVVIVTWEQIQHCQHDNKVRSMNVCCKC